MNRNWRVTSTVLSASEVQTLGVSLRRVTNCLQSVPDAGLASSELLYALRRYRLDESPISYRSIGVFSRKGRGAGSLLLGRGPPRGCRRIGRGRASAASRRAANGGSTDHRDAAHRRCLAEPSAPNTAAPMVLPVSPTTMACVKPRASRPSPSILQRASWTSGRPRSRGSLLADLPPSCGSA